MRDGEGGMGFGLEGTHEKMERMMVMSDRCCDGVDGGVWMVLD